MVNETDVGCTHGRCCLHRRSADMYVHEHVNKLQPPDKGRKACLACCSIARAVFGDVQLIVAASDSQDTDTASLRRNAQEIRLHFGSRIKTVSLARACILAFCM